MINAGSPSTIRNALLKVVCLLQIQDKARICEAGTGPTGAIVPLLAVGQFGQRAHHSLTLIRL